MVLFSKFSSGGINTYSIDVFVPYFLYSSQLYFDFIRVKKDYKLLCDFSSSLITEDIISEYKEEFEKLVLEKKEIPIGLSDKVFVRELLYRNKCFKLLVDMDISPLVDYLDNEEFYNFFINCNEMRAASESKELYRIC